MPETLLTPRDSGVFVIRLAQRSASDIIASNAILESCGDKRSDNTIHPKEK